MADQVKKDQNQVKADQDPIAADPTPVAADQDPVVTDPKPVKADQKQSKKDKGQAKKDKKGKKKNIFVRIFARIKKFFKDYGNEIKNITWCSGKQLLNNTWVVLVCIVAVAVVVGALDFGFSKLLTVIAQSVSVA